MKNGREEKIDVKIGSHAEKFWTNILEKIEEETKNARYTVDFNLEIIPILKRKIQTEKENFQKV